MLNKIRSLFSRSKKQKLGVHQPESDPEGPPPKSGSALANEETPKCGGIDTTKAPGSIEPPKDKEVDKKPLETSKIELETNNSFDVKELRMVAEHLENEAEKIREVAERMDKGYNVQVGKIIEESESKDE